MTLPLIIGLSGKCLAKEEINIIKNHKPYGFIIFQRNIKNLLQLKCFINHIKSLCNYSPLLMIDHEGGRINRFKSIFSQNKYSAKYFGNLFESDKNLFYTEINSFLKFNINLFKFLGINCVAYPVMDLFYKGSNKIIGDRAFSNNKNTVIQISKYVINYYQNNGIDCIAKHAPGHGLSKKDSHLELPVINASNDYLIKNDFSIFSNCNSKYLMTAHIVYSKIDKLCATFSKKIMHIIRKKINFKGKIMTDDICMKALKGNLQKKTIQPLIAGCDLILHCSGKINEIKKIISILNNRISVS